MTASIAMTAAGLWLSREVPVRLDVRAARNAVAARRFAAAEAPLARWLRARPEAAEAHYLKAWVALGRDRPVEALPSLAQARALGYPEASIARLMGVILARTGHDASAEPLLRRTLDTSTHLEPEVARELARIYLNSYRLKSAAAVIQRWARDAPRDAKPYLWQTEIDRRTRAEPNVLIDHYRAALERDPSLDRARLGLADALRAAHHNAEADAEYDHYLRRHPDDTAGLLGAGLNASERGDDAAAIRFLRRAAALGPDDHRARSELAAIALRRGENEDALSLLDEAIQIAPREAELRYRRGLVLTRLGQHDRAKREHEQADQLRAEQARISGLRDRLVQSPDDPRLQYEAAQWMIENGHDEEGLRWARKILDRRPDHAPTNRLLADYYARRGNVGLANYHRIHAANGSVPGPAGP